MPFAKHAMKRNAEKHPTTLSRLLSNPLAMNQVVRSDSPSPPDAARGALPVLHPSEETRRLFDRTGDRNETLDRLEALLPDYLKVQRWFGAKDQAIRRVVVEETLCVQEDPLSATLSIVRVDLAHRTEFYLLPLALAHGEEAERILEENPRAALAWFESSDDEMRGLLHDATANPAFWDTLFRWWQSNHTNHSPTSRYTTTLDSQARSLSIKQVGIFWGEQSNSLAFFDDYFCMKLYRRLEPGLNPETELLDHFTRAGFAYAPRLYGTLSLRHTDQTFVLATLQQALPVETDGWTYALAMTQRFLNRVAGTPAPETPEQPARNTDTAPEWLEEVAPEMLTLAHVLGIRTAELHRVLAEADTPTLRPEPGSLDDTHTLLLRVRREIEQTRRILDHHAGTLTDVPDDDAWQHSLHRLDQLARTDALCRKIRVHGDYHLGQVVYGDGEFYLLDFEGEPARTLAERRARDCSLRDVAGMLRSLDYAALSAWQDYRAQQPDEDDPTLEAWAFILVDWCETLFMKAYFAHAASPDLSLPPEARRLFVWTYLLQKALYEVRYELSHRPAWTWLPLRGLKRLLEEGS